VSREVLCCRGQPRCPPVPSVSELAQDDHVEQGQYTQNLRQISEEFTPEMQIAIPPLPKK